MSKKTLMQLCNELTLITENIKEQYPDLQPNLEEDLLLASPEKVGNSQKQEDSQAYLHKLKKNLQQQLSGQQPLAHALPDLGNKLLYNPERVEKVVLEERNGLKVILFAFSQNLELKTHSAPHDVILVMLEGLCAFTLDFQEPQVLHAGQVIRIPGKVKHSLKALSDFKMLLYI